jgi:hypothetical protein
MPRRKSARVAARKKSNSKAPAKAPAPRINLVVKKPATPPPPSSSSTLSPPPPSSPPAPAPAPKKVKKEKVYSYVLVTEVSFGEKKVLEESGVYLTGTYDLSSWERKEARLMDVKLKELKATGAVRSDCRATIATEGKGFNQTGRSVEGPDDWEEVEKLVKSFIDGGRKQVRVLLAVRYALPASEEDGDTDADSVLTLLPLLARSPCCPLTVWSRISVGSQVKKIHVIGNCNYAKHLMTYPSSVRLRASSFIFLPDFNWASLAQSRTACASWPPFASSSST